MSVPDPKAKPTMTVVEAGALLGLSRSSSYHAAKTGAIPTLRVGSRILVPTQKFREMLGFHDDPTHDDAEAPVAAQGTLDSTLRDAIIAAAEAFLRVMEHGRNL